MPTASLDLKIKLNVFPFVSPDFSKFAVTPALSEVESWENQFQKFVSSIPSDISQLTGVTPPPGRASIGEDQWKTFSPIDFPSLKNILGEVGAQGETKRQGPIDKALNSLNKVVSVLEKILSMVSLFITGFDSFSRFIASIVALVEKQVSELYDADSFKVGVYANVIAPEAFLSINSNNMDALKKAYGGFNGFLSRLNTSTFNTKDKNRPPFSSEDFVGGLVIVLDSTSLDSIWTELKRLAGMFSFMKLFGLNVLPPPPSNFRGDCGFYEKRQEGKSFYTAILKTPTPSTSQYGIRLRWDNNFVAPAYLISRSRIPGGTKKFVEFFPTYLMDDQETGEPGLFTIIKAWFGTIFSPRDRLKNITKAERRAAAEKSGDNVIVGYPLAIPEKIETVYEDPYFNDPTAINGYGSGQGKGRPKLVVAGLDLTQEYFDTDIALVKEGDKTVAKVKDNNGKLVPVTELFYVIQSCDLTGKIKGPYSKELVVTIKTCNDSYNTTDVIFHPEGRYEVLSLAGHARINTWSSIQLNAMFPWMSEITEFFNSLVKSLKGMTTSASNAFSAFLTQLKDKVQMYIDMVNALKYMVTGLKNFVIGPSVAFLNLTPKQGGMQVFLERIRSARLNPGEPSFSGPDGITIGLVIVYGYSSGYEFAGKQLKFAFDFISKFFTKD